MSQVKCRVLFVDDHEDTSEMFTLLLAEEYEIENAKTIAEALQQAAGQKFDLYILDKQLPDGSGLELCSRLNELTPGVPCIFYTGDAYEVHRAEAMAAGADGFVAKPDLDSLIESITKFLGNKECATT